MITADHGVDPTHPGTDHTREHVPLLARFAGHGGRRHDGPFADVGASVLRWLAGRDARRASGHAVHAVRNAAARALRRSRRAVALVALGCVGGGGGRGDPTPTPTETPGSPAERPEPTDEEQITELLSDRAAALEAGRPRAYAATATGAQRRRDRAHARRASRLRFREVTLETDDVTVSGDRATMRVATGYAIEGVRGTFSFERRMRARRTPDGWRVSAVKGGRGLPPWEVDDFRERRTEHFVVLAPTDVPVDELADRARGRLRRP